MKEDKEILEFQDIKKLLGYKTEVFDIQSIIQEFINKSNIERITRIKDTELDKICRLFYFGIKHTSYLNLNKDFSFTNNTKYQDIKISSILDYVMINLSMRLSLNSKSREELTAVIVELIKKETENIKKDKENKEESMLKNV